MDAEHDLGQADAGLVVVRGDALAASEDQLGAAAHAGTVHGGHAGAGQSRQRFVHALAILDVFQHGGVARIIDEFADVGADRETGGLGRMHDHARWLFDRQPLDDQPEFVEHRARDGVDAAAGAVEGEGDDAGVIDVDPPMSETQSFEHGECRAVAGCRTYRRATPKASCAPHLPPASDSR
jgi:hypothetical protein